MRSPRIAIAGFFLAFFALTVSPAFANYIYNLIPTNATTFQAQLTVTDAAVASGSMYFSISPAADSGGFVSLLGETPTRSVGNDNLSVVFNPDGTLSGNIVVFSYCCGLRIAGSEFNWSGVADDDA